MEIYDNEEQQVEAIKRFWKENGTAIIAGVVLGLGGLYGWRYFQDQQLESTMAASSAYTKLLEQQQKAADNPELLAQFQSFVDANSDSSYALLAAFVAAKDAVAKEDYASAAKQLNWVIAQAKQPEIKALAQLRLARVQNEQKDYAAALATLALPLPESFKAQQQELIGDVLLNSGELAKAKTAYQAAAAANKDAQNPILKVKLDELAHVTAA